MANPLGALGSVPIMQTVTDMLQRQANLRATQVATDMEQSKLNLLNQQYQRDQEYRDAILRGVTLNPSVNNPQTTSIADSQQQGLGASPMSGIVKTLNDERNSVLQSIQLAKAYNQDTKPLYTHLSNIDTNLREATRDYTKDQSTRMEQSANVLRDANSPQTLRAALNDVATNVGQAEADAIERRLPHDPVTGEILWNERAKQVVAPYVSKYLSTKDKADIAYKDNEYQRKLSEDAERVRHDKAEELRQSQQTALGWAGIKSREKMHAETMARLGGPDYKLTKDTQAQIDKISNDYKIRDYRKSVEVADSAASALTDPKRGYADVTAPAARTLADQFKLMIDNYRSRTGGKYQEAELSRMNGLLQRLDKFTETIGEGDKILAKDVMLQTAQQMQKLYTDRATDLAKEELQRANVLKQRGGNPMWLTLQTNVEDLERRGAAKQVTADGKPYVLFPKPGTEKKKKKGPEDFDVYELPTPPEQKPVVIME